MLSLGGCCWLLIWWGANIVGMSSNHNAALHFQFCLKINNEDLQWMESIGSPRLWILDAVLTKECFYIHFRMRIWKTQLDASLKYYSLNYYLKFLALQLCNIRNRKKATLLVYMAKIFTILAKQ
jgi:hypothetical protein